MPKKQHRSDNSKGLKARVDLLEELFVRLAKAGATESILAHGFESVSERLKSITNQLAPLKALGPEEPQLTDDQKTRKENLLAALVAPDPNVPPARASVPPPREDGRAANRSGRSAS